MEISRFKLTIRILISIVLLTAPDIVLSQAQDQPSAGKQALEIGSEISTTVNMDELKQLRLAVESSESLVEESKTLILKLVDQAVVYHEAEGQAKMQSESLRQAVLGAPERIRNIETELEERLPAPERVATAASGMAAGQREQHLRKLETELNAAASELKKSNEQLAALKNRLGNLQPMIAAAKVRLLEISDEIEVAPAPDTHPLMVTAQQAVMHAEQGKVRKEIELFESQLINHDTIAALLTAERDLAARGVTRQEMLVKSWQIEVQRLRELEAKKERVVAEDAKKLAADMPPIIQNQYDITIELGKTLEAATAEEAEIRDKLERQKAGLEQLEADYAIAREQVKYPMHTTEAIGLALREQRRTLPSIKTFRQQSALRRTQLGELRASMLDLDRRQNNLSDLDKAVIQVLQRESGIEKADPELLKAELRRILADRRDVIQKLQATYQRLFKSLQSLEFIEQQIAARAEEEARFLDEHLLWIRSAKTVGLQDLRNLPSALKWIFSPANWGQALETAIESAKRYPFQWALGILVPLAFICLRPWAHRKLSRIALKVYSLKTDSFVLTLKALALTLRASLGWPLLIGLAGWQLERIASSKEFAFAAGSGLFFAAKTLAGSLFLYEIGWKEGVAKVHFKWPESVRRTIRRHLQWFIPLLVTTSFTMTAIQSHNNADYANSLGRLALALLMLGFFAWSAYVLRFSGEIYSMLTHRRQNYWLVRLRFIWYPLSMGVPLILIALSTLGYYYSASALYLRLGETIALVLGLIFAKDLMLRWLFIVQRRLVFEELERKKEAELQKQDQEETPGTIEGDAVVIEEPEVDLDQIYEKNRVLLRTMIFFTALVGLWFIWANVLPALNILENVKLWSYTSEVDGIKTSVPITLADLMAGFIIAIVTVVAAKNLPGLLEIILLNRFSMDYGARHAFKTIFNYSITAVGIILTFTTIGIKWSNLQWLIAALSVGLGFGLQEVVANFICGLIVLFERPFRIGDTVTIGDISGTVTRIQIRATTIIDWDRKELIVPNKEFITGRLVNWSLTDNITRIKIPVGIAYGSDTKLAERLLLSAARSNPMVLENPEPQAVFLGFGDNSLSFEVRVFISGINDWIPMLHKLNQTIDEEFRKANVTISFPQRDVHLDQIGPLEVRVVSGQ